MLGLADNDSGCADELLWTPGYLSPDQVRRYYSYLPSSKVPCANSEGERSRIDQLTRQLPPQDTDPRYCRSLAPCDVPEMQHFRDSVKRDNLGRGIVRQLPNSADYSISCEQCRLPLVPNQLAVFASRAGNAHAWHPQCFVCSRCSSLLVDLIYFYDNQSGKVYCGRHFAEVLKPRCASCDELIFSDECTEAEGFTWHIEHFVCVSCEEPLASQRYLMKGGDTRPYCPRCYYKSEGKSLEICTACQCRIRYDEPQVSKNGLFWHDTPSCYSCHFCGQAISSLSDTAVFDNITFDIFCSEICQINGNSAAINKENLESHFILWAPPVMADYNEQSDMKNFNLFGETEGNIGLKAPPSSLNRSHGAVEKPAETFCIAEHCRQHHSRRLHQEPQNLAPQQRRSRKVQFPTSICREDDDAAKSMSKSQHNLQIDGRYCRRKQVKNGHRSSSCNSFENQEYDRRSGHYYKRENSSRSDRYMPSHHEQRDGACSTCSSSSNGDTVTEPKEFSKSQFAVTSNSSIAAKTDRKSLLPPLTKLLEKHKKGGTKNCIVS